MARSLINLPPDAEQVLDADEEVFILYSTLQSASYDLVGPDGFRGLGHVDSRQDTLAVMFELVAPFTFTSEPTHAEKKSNKAKKQVPHTKHKPEPESKTIQVDLWQDKTALRTRKGDTGSVLWRASYEFAKFILQEYYFPPVNENGLFDTPLLADTHILELGAGTGLLSVLLSPLVKKYTVTDIAELLPLIRKNVALNVPAWPAHSSANPSRSTNQKSNISIEELNWETFSALPPAVWPRYCPWLTHTSNVTPPLPQSHSQGNEIANSIDLILAVDCIYHPALLPSLVCTLDGVAHVGTWAVVVAELRQEDVVRDFLTAWLSVGDASDPGDDVGGKKWEVWRVSPSVLGVHYVVWMGRKVR